MKTEMGDWRRGGAGQRGGKRLEVRDFTGAALQVMRAPTGNERQRMTEPRQINEPQGEGENNGGGDQPDDDKRHADAENVDCKEDDAVYRTADRRDGDVDLFGESRAFCGRHVEIPPVIMFRNCAYG